MPKKISSVSLIMPPSYRHGATVDPAMVNVIEEFAETKNVAPVLSPGVQYLDKDTFLTVKCWVKNVCFHKLVWIDLHVFGISPADGKNERLVRTCTLPFTYHGASGGNGDFFIFDDKVFDGANAGPGWCSTGCPEPLRLQYRIYYEVNGRLFTDGLAVHEHQFDPNIQV